LAFIWAHVQLSGEFPQLPVAAIKSDGKSVFALTPSLYG
jgi:hypothetical protein